MRGIFISFEGGDGGGKTTQLRALTERLQQAGRTVLNTREPGGTPLGESIRHLLQTAKEGEGMVPEAELLLFAASRAQLVREVIEPALSRGEWVIADRFFDSTTVYQGVARALEPDEVARVNAFAVGETRPDLTLVFDIDPRVARERLAKRGEGAADRMERLPLSFFEAVRAGYLALAEREPQRVRVIDAAQPIEQIAAQIWTLIEEQFHGLLT